MAEGTGFEPGSSAISELIDCMAETSQFWRMYGDSVAKNRRRPILANNLFEILMLIADVIQAEGLDADTVVGRTPFSYDRHGAQGEAEHGSMPCPPVVPDEEGIEVTDGFEDWIGFGDALWLAPGPGATSRSIVVGTTRADDRDEEWTFGAEWNGNVARNVEYLRVTSSGDDDARAAVVLFNDAFDENAVDIRAMDGKTHVVLVQGLVASSFASVWKGLHYKRGYCGRAREDDALEVTFPSISLMGHLPEPGMDGQSSFPIVSLTGLPGDSDALRDAGQDGHPTGLRIGFNDMFCLFVYEEPFDGYDAQSDFNQVDMPSVALLVTDIKLLQRDAERLTDYDPDWGGDTVS